MGSRFCPYWKIIACLPRPARSRGGETDSDCPICVADECIHLLATSNNVGLDPRYPSSESDNSAFSRTPLLACFSPIHFSVFLHNYSETDLATDLAVRVLKYSRTAVYQEHGGVKKKPHGTRTTRTRHAAPALPPLRLGHTRYVGHVLH